MQGYKHSVRTRVGNAFLHTCEQGLTYMQALTLTLAYRFVVGIRVFIVVAFPFPRAGRDAGISSRHTMPIGEL